MLKAPKVESVLNTSHLEMRSGLSPHRLSTAGKVRQAVPTRLILSVFVRRRSGAEC